MRLEVVPWNRASKPERFCSRLRIEATSVEEAEALAELYRLILEADRTGLTLAEVVRGRQGGGS